MNALLRKAAASVAALDREARDRRLVIYEGDRFIYHIDDKAEACDAGDDTRTYLFEVKPKHVNAIAQVALRISQQCHTAATLFSGSMPAAAPSHPSRKLLYARPPQITTFFAPAARTAAMFCWNLGQL